VPGGCKVEKTEHGATCWWVDQSGVALEEELMRLGKRLFGIQE
jgi:hypothetical protein